MNRNGNNINGETPCPDQHQLVQYALGKLPASEQHRIERHLLDCPFCEEALEGIQLMKNPEDLISINEDLHQKIAKPSTPQKSARIIRFSPMRIAAILVLLLISGSVLWYFLPNVNNEKLFTQEFKPYPAPKDSFSATMLPPPVGSTEALQEKSNEIVVKQEQSVTANKAPVNPAVAVKDEEKEIVQVQELTEQVDHFDEVSARVVSAENEEKDAPASADLSLDKASALKKETDKKGEVVVSKQTAKKEKVASIESAPAAASGNKMTSKYETSEKLFETGMNYYREARYEEALRNFKLATSYPESSFYSGICLLSLNRPKEALPLLDKYLSSGHKLNDEAAWWYKALALIKTDQRTEARTALEKVISFKGGYQQRAEELLRKM